MVPGMTLQDYAEGGWCKSGFGGTSATTGQTREAQSRGKPYWIKSQKDKVDAKVNKL